MYPLHPSILRVPFLGRRYKASFGDVSGGRNPDTAPTEDPFWALLPGQAVKVTDSGEPLCVTPILENTVSLDKMLSGHT